MKKNIYRKIMAITCIALGVYACTGMDEYKDLYLKDGIKSYTGKIDSVKVYSGHERVMIEGLFMSDPKVTGCMIYWNSKMDSMNVPVIRTDNVDTLRQIINLPENLYNFEIYTYDQYGNHSVPVYATGDSYGANFISQLINRPLKETPIATEKGLTVRFLPVDQTLGPVHTIVSYINLEGKKDTVHVATNQEGHLIENYKKGTEFTYITQYVPDTLCIDTFSSKVSEVISPLCKIESIKIHGYSSQEETGESNGQNGWAKHGIDNDITTYWHSQWQGQHPGFPHYLSFDLNNKHKVKAVSLIPRQNTDNMVKDFKVFSSKDGIKWDEVESFTMNHIQNEQQFFVFSQSVDTQFVKLMLENGYSSDPHTALAEIYFYE